MRGEMEGMGMGKGERERGREGVDRLCVLVCRGGEWRIWTCAAYRRKRKTLLHITLVGQIVLETQAGVSSAPFKDDVAVRETSSRNDSPSASFTCLCPFADWF